MDNLNRRAFLGRGGALAAALFALQANPAFLAEALGAAPELGEAELATYTALLGALGPDQVKTNKIDPAKADQAIAFLKDWFGQQEEDTRRAIVALLRMIEDGPDGEKFSKHAEKDALKMLRSWHSGRTKAERKFDARADEAAEGHPQRTGNSAANETAFKRYVDEQQREVQRRAREIQREHGGWVLMPDPVTGLPPYHPEYDDAQPVEWPDETKDPVVTQRNAAAAAVELAGLFFYRATAREIETRHVVAPSL